MNNGRGSFWRFVGLLAVGALLAGCRYGSQVETYEEETGYRGLARANPYLAAERMLGELGSTVTHADDFGVLAKMYGTIITPLDSFVNYGDTAEALKWVRRGGHLIVFLSDGEYWRDDWQKWSWISTKSESVEDEGQKFLDAFHIKSLPGGTNASQALELRIDGRRLSVHLEGEIQFSGAVDRADFRAEDALVSYKQGLGRVTLLANARPFRNRYISDADHPALVHALATLNGANVVCFLNGTRASLWRMLWEKARPAVIALGVLLLVWLWRSLPRFGPPFTPEEKATRDFSEQLRLTGAFLWTRDEIRALLDPLQRELRTTMERQGFNLDHEAACREVSNRTGLSLDRVRMAVFIVEPETAHLFLRTVQDLQLIRAKF